MKTKDLVKLLESNGWKFKRHGADHDVYIKAQWARAFQGTKR